MRCSQAVRPETPIDGFGTARFTTTRWSIVSSCSDSASDEEKAQAAIAELCKIYWRPVFAFICRQGHSVPDAQDLTQEFFAKVLKGRLLQSADRNRGRFRSLLHTALQRFLRDQADKHQARKRGGDLRFVSWDDWMTEAPSHLSIPETESAIGRPKEFSMCDGRQRLSSAPCDDWATNAKSTADGVYSMS